MSDSANELSPMLRLRSRVGKSPTAALPREWILLFARGSERISNFGTRCTGVLDAPELRHGEIYGANWIPTHVQFSMILVAGVHGKEQTGVSARKCITRQT